MGELDDWATETGYGRPQLPSAVRWFGEHPDRLEQVKDARTRGWSWHAIFLFLKDRASFPYTENPLKEAAQEMGVR